MSRKSVKNFLKQVNNPYPTESQSYTAWEKGFIEGFDSSQANPCFEENDMIDFSIWRSTNNKCGKNINTNKKQSHEKEILFTAFNNCNSIFSNSTRTKERRGLLQSQPC